VMRFWSPDCFDLIQTARHYRSRREAGIGSANSAVQTVTRRAEDARSSSEASHLRSRCRCRRRTSPASTTMPVGTTVAPANRVRGGRRIADAYVGGDGGSRVSGTHCTSLRVSFGRRRALCWTGGEASGGAAAPSRAGGGRSPEIHLDDGGGRGSICEKNRIVINSRDPN
jgi:hypothetical protein